MSAEQHADRVQLERELDDDPEVAAAATERPKELRLVVLARGHHLPVDGHDRRREQVVEREAERRAQMSYASAERQPGDPGVAERSAGGGKPVTLAGRVEVFPERAALAGRSSRLGIDTHLAHQPQVDHQAAVTDAVSGDSVSSAAHRDREARSDRIAHSRDDVLDVERPHDELRPSLDHAVERRPRGVETPIRAGENRSAMALSQLCKRGHTRNPTG